MGARIYRPCPNPMQSAGAGLVWILCFEPTEKCQIEPLMGYNSTSDMQSQIRLKFKTLDAAKAYAEKHNIDYVVEMAHEPTPKQVSYSDNFLATRKTPWTH